MRLSTEMTDKKRLFYHKKIMCNTMNKLIVLHIIFYGSTVTEIIIIEIIEKVYYNENELLLTPAVRTATKCRKAKYRRF